jgi:HTH-type transcriptional regulator / antitoxin HipB
MKNKNRKLKIYKFDEIKDEFIGKKGTQERESYEFELKLDILGETIKRIRLDSKLTQEQLGKYVGVQKAQISKLESGMSNVTVDTIQKVFSALHANVSLNVHLRNKKIKVA